MTVGGVAAHRSEPARRGRRDDRARRARPPRRRSPQPETIPLDIVYEDADLIVIDKPAGLVVHPGAGNLSRHAGQRADRALRRQPLRHRRRQAAGHRAPARQGYVGAAGRRQERRGASRAFRAIRRPRPRRARCAANTTPLSGACRIPISAPSMLPSIAIPTTGRSRRWPAPAAASAVTHYARAGALSRASPPSSRCRLETGRTHQIRVHMAHIGHPLVGDAVYGAGFLTKAETLPDGTAGRGQGVSPPGAACPAAAVRAPAHRANRCNLRRIGQRI